MKLKAKIYVKPGLVQRLVSEHYDGFTGLSVEWEARAKENPRFPPARSHPTLWRWARHGVPIKAKPLGSRTERSTDLSVFALAGLLKVDPLTLFDYERNGFFADFQTFKVLTHEDSFIAQWGWPIWRMFIPQPTWPDESIANFFFNQHWITKPLDVASSAGQHTLSSFVLRLPGRTDNESVSVHIAHRRQRAADRNWRYCGSIVIEGANANTYDERGTHSAMLLRDIELVPFGIENLGRPAEWMAACMRSFEVSDDVIGGSGPVFGW